MNPSLYFAEIPVSDMASATVARRVAGELAARLGFSASRRAEAVLVTSELAHNHVMHHTVRGQIRISGFHAAAIPCLSITSLDQGPGLYAAEETGGNGKTNSRGGLGAGLGTVLRLSDRLDIFSRADRPGLGCPYETIISALLGPDHDDNTAVARIGGSLAVLGQPRSGSDWCGDGVNVQQDQRYTRITLVDSPGLGRAAADITNRAFQELNRLPLLWPPAELLEELEFALADTPGAAVHILQFDGARGRLASAGIGNIVLRLAVDGRQVPQENSPGRVGQGKWRRITGQVYRVYSALRVFMHTDGQKRIETLPEDLTLPPAVAAHILFEPLTPQRDDATLVTWQWPEKSTNHYIS
jgi:anti-sigma regulatory factor (Ser/Thr protein kinase)